jgi:dienelactone hydrolase
MIKSRILMHMLFLGLILIFSIAMTPLLSLAQLELGPFEVGDLAVSDITISDDVEFLEGTFVGTCTDEEPYLKPENNRAIIYFPATDEGAVISDRFPLIVFGHGMRAKCSTCPENSPDDNGEDFRRWSVILRHLASWGFIIISPDLSWLTPQGDTIGIEDRMFLLRDAVNYMLDENSRVGSPFANRVRSTCIGAMGHSMGADAAILLGTSGEMGENISVIAPIAPPNTLGVSSNHIPDFAPRPVILFQGTKDVWYCFFSPSKSEAIYAAYDTAERSKHLITIEGANHFGYTDDICDNSDNFSIDKCPRDLLPWDDQQSIAKAYLTAFFRRYLSPGCVTELDVYLNGSQEFEGLESFDIEVVEEVTNGTDCPCRQLPTCNAAGPYIAECFSPTTPIPLDGSGSTNPDPDDPLTYFWSTDCPGANFDDSASATPQLDLVFDACPTECNVFLNVTDSSGLLDSCSAPVTVFDETEPQIICPENVIIQCDESTDPSNTGFATANDVCDPNPDVDITASNIVVGDCPEESLITRTWTGSDACSNFDSCDQTIDVQDTTAPEIDCNAPTSITPPDAPILFTSTATDNCASSLKVEITGYDCFYFTPNGKRIDKTESCVVEVEGDTITILDTGGIGNHITWSVQVTDNCGNANDKQCEIEVVNPGH